MIRRIFTCFIVLFLSRNVSSFYEIIEKTTVLWGEFPFVAAMIKTDSNITSVHCIGAIISNRHILTSGHCVRSKKPLRGVQILTGTHKLISGGNIYKIKQIFIHPKYTGGGHYDRRKDIAILSLTTIIIFNTLQHSIGLTSNDIESALKGIIIRWGHKLSQETNPLELQKVDVKNYHAPVCQILTTTKLYDDQICSIPPEKLSICNGAGGGILVVNDQLVGVVSYEKFPCGYGNPIFSTKIYSYRTFILNVMKKI